MTIIYFILLLLLFVIVYDFFQKKHAITRNFPLFGHLRFFAETIGPGFRQYWIANDKEEQPFSRSERSWVYATSKKQNNNFGFGTTEVLYEVGYPILKHSAFPIAENKVQYFSNDHTLIPCAKNIGASHSRQFPYRPSSIINISAMSFGSLGANAISALNKGAKIANCYHNTGEGGVSPYHNLGADIVWQLGTGYFGARDHSGQFSITHFKKTIKMYPNIKMIEIKLSQGAKPGKGGILPAQKITSEISKIRGIPMEQDCISPNYHSAFNTVEQLIKFIEQLASESGLPVGIKSAIGELDFWDELAIKMKSLNRGPDFINIDGGEGGTGAAPLTFSDHVALPFKIGFKRVYKIFQSHDLIHDITWIGSGKLGFPDRTVVAFAMGCDLVSVGREAMLSIGCIQAQHCHTDNCPTGVATQNWWLQRGLDVPSKAIRFSEYIKGFRREVLQLSHACGYEHPCQFTGQDVEVSTGTNLFKNIEEVLGYKKEQVDFITMKDLFNL